MHNHKIKTYLGFCIKAGKVALGLDRAEALKRSVYLVLVDKTLSSGSTKRAVKLAQKFRCPLFVCEGESLGEILQRPACKAVAVSEKNLASAIIAEAEKDGNFRRFQEVGIGGNI